jgi:hypothetical protein
VRLFVYLCALVLAFGTLPGCIGSKMAPVTGRVLCNSRPVAAAQVTFSPVARAADEVEPGKSATGFTNAEGLFALSTHQELDGAQVGMHEVMVELDDTNPSPCKRLVRIKLEVKPGVNDFNIELNQ